MEHPPPNTNDNKNSSGTNSGGTNSGGDGRAVNGKARWRRWAPKVAASIIGLALAYFLISYLAGNVNGFTQGVHAALNMPTGWTLAAAAGAVIAIAVYPLTAPAAIPGLKYTPAFIDRAGGFAISTTIPFGGGPIAVAVQYTVLAKYRIQQRLAAAAVAADAIWTYLMTFGTPAIAVGLLWAFDRTSLNQAECGPVSCHTVYTVCAVFAAVTAASIAVLVVVLRSKAEAEKVGRWAQTLTSKAAHIVKKTPPDVNGAVLRFNDTAATMVKTRWKQITITNVVAQLAPLLVIIATLYGVNAERVTALEAFAAFAIAGVFAAVPLAPGGAGTVDAALIGMLVAFGADVEQAVAADVVWRALYFLPQMLVGWASLGVFWVRGRMSTKPLTGIRTEVP